MIGKFKAERVSMANLRGTAHYLGCGGIRNVGQDGRPQIRAY